MNESRRNATASLIEVRNDRGDLIGGITVAPIPGVMADPFRHVVTYVGWAHAWGADNPAGAYLPVFIGIYDNRKTLVAEIERRAREAQA